MREIQGVGLEEIIGEGDLFGKKNKFRKLCNGMVKSAVGAKRWFTICNKIHDDQVDVMRIKNNEGVSLGQMVHDINPGLEYRPAIFKFLIRNYLCYLENPIVTKDRENLGFKNSFNKCLVTANTDVIAEWLGISSEQADMEYGGKLQFYDEDDSVLLPYYKLTVAKDGVRKVSRPRKDLDVSSSGTRIIPLFALKTGVDLLYGLLLDDTYNITFCKDSGQIREINTTFNVSKIKEYYSSREDYVANAVESWYMGDFLENPNMQRGYIRVFEVGGSVYDSPTRSINYARIIKIEQAEPDLSFINVDLDSVIPTFKQYCYDNQSINKEISQVVDMLEIFEVGSDRKLNGKDITSVHQLIQWVDNQFVLLSTVFQRKLALFMFGCPQWFEGYTGEPMETSGLDTANWDEDELDLG